MTTTPPQPPGDEVIEVRPGNGAAAATVEGWLRDYAANRDPVLRERIIFAYLGLADRLARRYRTSRGTAPEDLTQTARAALIAAVDRYDPAKSNGFSRFAVACVIGELNATCATPAGGCTCPGRSRNSPYGCARRPTRSSRPWAAHPP